MNLSRIKKIFTYRLTFLMVPHGAGVPRQISVHLSFFLFLIATWSFVTFWGSYLSARHIDYWRTQASNQVLKMKVKYLLAQVEQTRGYLDEVKTVDGQLRQLLKYQNGSKLTRADETASTDGAGGPTLADQNDLARSLDSLDPDVSWPRLMTLVGSMKSEARNRISSYQDLTGWIDTQRRIFKATPRGRPCSGHLTSFFGARIDPLTGAREV
ncbi:MAG: hypothetical protein JO102_01875, partial [Elusimicrobia bacterium]|nr:hypothetical protein [Elusimicrobiota bacterium]